MTFADSDDLDWEFALVRTLGIRPVLGGRTWRQGEKREFKTCRCCIPMRPESMSEPARSWLRFPTDRDQEPVRSFETFTRDLNSLADWLQACGIRSVAMESTSVYWIP